MPRRDELSEDKRKQLMQEHEQLQKLMLQARSSVRRSSLKEEEATEASPDKPVSRHTVINVEEENKERSATTVSHPEVEDLEEAHNIPIEQPTEENIPEKKPLTEKELFPTEIELNTAQAEQKPLTERELFKETKTTSAQPLQQNRTVNVILPNQITPASVVQPKVERMEAVAAKQQLTEEIAPKQVREEQTAEIQEENTYTYRGDEIRQPERSRNRAVVLVLIAVLLAALGGYYLYESNQNRRATTATRNEAPVSAVPTPTTQPVPDTTQVQRTGENGNQPATQTTTSNEKSVAKKEDPQKPLSEELKDFDNVTIVKTPATVKPQETQSQKEEAPKAISTASSGKYKVISKAYFHNEPDESTRRKAFMTHWDNAVLTPVEERNDFIYIVFTNHLGQTSKGWLRKGDLKRIE